MLRSATLADLRVVVSWITSARECELWSGPRVRFPIDLDTLPVTTQFTEANAFALAQQDHLVAFGQILAKAGRRGHLARPIVCPASRGQGHGEALVRALVAEACQRAYTLVSLNVNPANAPAIGLY